MRRIYLVCSPQARVGATTTARLLAEYQLWLGRSLSIYDTDAHARDLSSLFPDCSVSADLSRTPGQMTLFDGLLADGAQTSIVDVCARSYGPFWRLAQELAFLPEVHRLGVAIAALFVTDLSPPVLKSAGALAAMEPALDVIAVANEGAGPLAQPLRDALPDLPGERSFEIAALRTRRGPRADLPGTPLAASLLRGAGAALPGSIERIFLQFRCHELRTALAALE